MISPPVCSICGEPMEEIESMFKFHGSIGPCPKPPLKKPEASPKEPLTLNRTNGQLAVMTDTSSGWFGWLFYKHPDGQWVSLQDLGLSALAKRVAELESRSWICYTCGDGLKPLKKLMEIENLNKELAAARQEIERLQHVINYDMPHPQLTQANARIKDLETDNLLALGIADKFANERDEMKEREQKLVAIIEKMYIIASPNDKGHSPRNTASQVLGIYFDEFCSLKANKGGA